LIEIFLQAHQIDVNRWWFGHHVQQRHRSADGSGEFASELHCFLDEFLSTSTNQKPLQVLAFANRHEHRRRN
jgi:hypothetical protein